MKQAKVYARPGKNTLSFYYAPAEKGAKEFLMYTIPYHRSLADFFGTKMSVGEIYAYCKWGNHRRDHQIAKLKNIYIPYARKEIREMSIRRDFEYDSYPEAA